MPRTLKFSQAIHEALDLCLERDPSVYLMGQGVPDPKGVFGTTLGLAQKYGSDRVLDTPTAENGMTGVAIGSALVGMRPVMVHHRLDFALLALEQIVNQAAKWHFVYGDRMPLVIRMLIGRGWGQGPSHSQSLQSWFAHVPGLKVVMPAFPADAKGLLISAIEDDNPVMFLEHRWLYNVSGDVPAGHYRVPLGLPQVAQAGTDLTIVATSYMTLEALRAAQLLGDRGVSAEVIDIRTLAPLDDAPVLESVRKTGHLIVADTGWSHVGFAAEILARVVEKAFADLKTPPRRLCLPDHPTPMSPALTRSYYPRARNIVSAALEILGIQAEDWDLAGAVPTLHDVPDPSFAGPF
jgi:pyruvate dehydrogenase E1 component beta subunit